MLHVSSDTHLILPRNIFITIIIRMKNTSDDEYDTMMKMITIITIVMIPMMVLMIKLIIMMMLMIT